MMKKHRTLTIILTAIVLLIALGAGLLFKGPSEVSRPVQFKSPDERQKLAEDVNNKAAIFEYMLKNRQGDRASIDINEKSLNAYIQSSPSVQEKLQKIGAKDVVVKLHKDQVLVGMRIPFNGTMLPASADIEVRQVPGRKLVVNIKSMKIGSYPAPRSMVDKIAGKAFKTGIMDLPQGLVTIAVDEGKVTAVAVPSIR